MGPAAAPAGQNHRRKPEEGTRLLRETQNPVVDPLAMPALQKHLASVAFHLDQE